MKFFLSAAILIISFTANSQLKLGIYAGPLATTSNYKVDGTKQDNSMKAGFQIGAGLKVPFENKLFFSPAIHYGYKGYKVKLSKSSSLPDPSAIDNNTSFHTVELSFLLQHDFSTVAGHWFFKVGPTLDFPLFGNEKYNTSDNKSIDRSMKFSYYDYGHYLANVTIQLGYEAASGVFVYAHYDHGLTNMNNRDGGPSIMNRAFGITIGKFLNSKIIIDTSVKE